MPLPFWITTWIVDGLIAASAATGAGVAFPYWPNRPATIRSFCAASGTSSSPLGESIVLEYPIVWAFERSATLAFRNAHATDFSSSNVKFVRTLRFRIPMYSPMCSRSSSLLAFSFAMTRWMI